MCRLDPATRPGVVQPGARATRIFVSATRGLLHEGSDVRFFSLSGRPVQLAGLVAVACLAVLLVAGSTGAATGSCAEQAGLFRDRLEVVTEASLDGRTAAVAPALERARAAWRPHGTSLGRHAGGGAADPGTALRLPDLVDEIEKVLH